MRFAQRRAAPLMLGEAIMWSLAGLVVAVGLGVVLVVVLRALVKGSIHVDRGCAKGAHPRVLGSRVCARPSPPALAPITGGFLE
jgi:hypothetical protein